MKALVCELCGGNDFVKQDGLFACQHCGTKYTTEEARKLMSDEVVTVKVDNTSSINNNLEIARNACKTSNYKEAESYANKILEMEPNCAEAWEIKGVAAGWQSTLGNVRFGESIECWSKAIQLCTNDEKEMMKERVGDEMSTMVRSLISMRADLFGKSPTENNYDELVGCKAFFDAIISFTIKIGAEIIDQDSIFEYAAICMKKAAEEGRITANNFFGPEYSDKNRYAYKTWLEWMHYCISVLESAAILAKKEETVRSIFNLATDFQTEVKNSKCYKMEVGPTGVYYVTDLSLDASATQRRKDRIAEYNVLTDKYIEEIKKHNEEKYRKRVADYWNLHANEKEILVDTKREIEDIKANNYPLAKVIYADIILTEINNVMNNCDDAAVNALISEINQGIVESRKAKTYKQIEEIVSKGTNSKDLSLAEELLTILGDYKNAPELLSKCQRLGPMAQKREEENAKNQINALYNKLQFENKIDKLEIIRNDLLKYKDYANADELNRRVDDRIAYIKKVQKKKKKKLIISIIAGTIGFVLAIVGIKTGTTALSYSNAISKMNAGQYEEAIVEFEKLGNYKESKYLTLQSYLKCKGDLNLTKVFILKDELNGYKDTNQLVAPYDKYYNELKDMEGVWREDGDWNPEFYHYHFRDGDSFSKFEHDAEGEFLYLHEEAIALCRDSEIASKERYDYFVCKDGCLTVYWNVPPKDSNKYTLSSNYYKIK